MTALNAKQEAIKKAYGELYDNCKKSITENGWLKVHYSLYQEASASEYDFLSNEVEVDLIDRFIRPKSLQGIENNNGWIKIESEPDLPKEGMHHSILLDSECINGYRNYDVIVFYEVNSKFRKKEISHYQPIEKPNPPIY